MRNKLSLLLTLLAFALPWMGHAQDFTINSIADWDTF